MAERVLEAALPLLGRAAPAGRSGVEPLAGGAAADPATTARLPPDLRARVTAVHGSDAEEVLACAVDADDLTPIAPAIPLCAAEVRHAVRREMARTLADVLERRTRLALFGTARAREIAPRVAAIVATELGWSAERRESEVAAFTRQCDARLAWRGVVSPTSVAAAGRSA
jgi:glycerol-3-phosphate dehydrogenase